MLTKEYISQLKANGNGDLHYLTQKQKDSGSLVFILENLGHLPKNFDGSFLIELLQHPHHQVRLLAVKNIGKLQNTNYIRLIAGMLDQETNTSVRREIVSAIGRLRQEEFKEVLYRILEDNDPKIVCQAIRGLLVFEKEHDVEQHLKPLINHPNEMVRTVIYKEFFAEAEAKNHDRLPHPETYKIAAYNES